MRLTRIALPTGVLIGLSFLAGCGSTHYYEIKDPTSGKVYYTTSYEQKDGTTTLTDDKTKAEVTVQNVEVKDISKDQYMLNVPSDK